MKMQHIAIIFIIIILPIAMMMSSYIWSQIDTINLQITYNAKLTDSTHDAVKAFRINTVNNRYSSVSDSKIRDIEAAVNTFYTSLSSSEDLSKQDLRSYVPALVFTLYDGYYIYSKYDNVYLEDPKTATVLQPILQEEELKKEKYTNYGLKPYIYYSCRYQDSTRNFVVNFTLDNAITIYGTFSGTYKTMSGYLINPDAVIDMVDTGNPENWRLVYDTDGIRGNGDDVTITPEVLTEHLLFVQKQADGKQEGDYDYLVYNGQKIYYDPSASVSNSTTKYFRYQDYNKVYITNSYANQKIVDYLRKRTGETFELNGGTVTYFRGDGHLHSTSSFEYYQKARNFSLEVKSLTNGITQTHAVDEKGNKLELAVANTAQENSTSIFVANKNNDPLLSRLYL